MKVGMADSVSTREGSMSYSKAGKIKDFTPATTPSRGWQPVVHTVLISLCFGFVAAVILGLVP
ncbi:hypothetical protein ASF69_21805 [Rhizobium sp. Leaf311]|jgi:hypothetical protein|nr:hypothetical protein ASF69_21805 [Rhizobium sp. Leaf311]